MAHLFVSYSRVDSDFTEEFVRRLGRMFPQHTLWHDGSLHGGERWWQKILAEIARCDIFIYLLSNESVTSPYCQAEFAEARRLQKRIITVQVRDRTKLSGELSEIQYVDMKHGLDDAGGQTDLVAAVSYQTLHLPSRRPPPLSKTVTPKPPVGDESARADDEDVETPTLEVPASAQPPAKSDRRFQLILALIGAGAVIVAALIGLIPPLLNQINASATQISVIPTTPPTTIPTPSSPTPILDIALVVGTLDAQAALQQATMNVENTAAARATAYAVGTLSIQNATETATLWTPTPTPNITASIEAYRTQQAAFLTATATLWTATPTPTPTDTLTPTNTPTPTPTATFTPTLTPLPPTAPPTLSPEELALTPVTGNADWTAYEQDFDGVTMMLVPAGCFEMGGDPNAYDYGTNQNVADGGQQCFDQPFWIDKTEVTNAQFATLHGVAANPSYWTDPNRPREKITWFEARDYCALRGARLPTEAEWEYAARGPDDWFFPWGNDFVADNVVYGDNSGGQTADVGSRQAGESWVGALDLSGNVWEWTGSIYRDYPYGAGDGRENTDGNRTDVLRAVRGGSWYNFDLDVRAASRYGDGPDVWCSIIGLRCVRSY